MDAAAAPAIPGQSGTMMQKSEVNYRRSDGSAACADCGHFLSPDKCDVVLGDVAPAGLCDMHAPKGDATRMMFGGGLG